MEIMLFLKVFFSSVGYAKNRNETLHARALECSVFRKKDHLVNHIIKGIFLDADLMKGHSIPSFDVDHW